MELRVVIADDNLLVREGVTALLAELDDIELVDALVDSEPLVESQEAPHGDGRRNGDASRRRSGKGGSR